MLIDLKYLRNLAISNGLKFDYVRLYLDLQKYYIHM